MKPRADLLPELVRARRVLRYIDGVVYDWDEFEMPRRNGEPLDTPPDPAPGDIEPQRAPERAGPEEEVASIAR